VGGLCAYPSLSDQQSRAQIVRATSCPSVFFLPESGDFESLIDNIKFRIRQLALDDPDTELDDRLLFTEHRTYFDRKLKCRQYLAQVACSSSGKTASECSSIVENIQATMTHEDL